MDISSIYANAGYTNYVSKSSSTQKTSNTEKTEQTTEMTDAEKLENFKKGIWNEIDSLSWDSRMNISIQITDKAFERMMNDPDFKKDMMQVIRDESAAAHPPGDTSLTWIDENGYKGYSYIDIESGHTAFAAHTKDKDSFYSKKATKKQDYNELYEKERQQKKLQQEKLDDSYWDSVDQKRTLLKKEQADSNKIKATNTQNAYSIREMVEKNYKSLEQYATVDPTGEIERKAFIEEIFRQIKESVDVVQSYYASANAENQTHDDPYNYIVNKYNSKRYETFHSPDFRSDMSEDQRKMAQEQELAMLFGQGFYSLGDPYAWASRGGVPTFEEREQQIQDAVQKALDDKKAEMKEQNSNIRETKVEHMVKAYEKIFANANDGIYGTKMDDKTLKL